MPVTFEAQHAATVFAGALPMQAHELERALGSLGTRRQEECLFKLRRCVLNQVIDKIHPFLCGERVGMQQGLVQHPPQRRHDTRIAVAGIGDEDGAGEIEPAVAPGVEHLKALGAIPDHGQLAVHRVGLGGVEPLQ